MKLNQHNATTVRRNGLAPAQSEWLGYDRADRLTGMTRGKARRTLGPASQGAPPKPLTVDFEQRWTLDALDNWERFKQDDTGDGTWDIDQARRHDGDCRVTSIEEDGHVLFEPRYDAAGNMILHVPRPGNWNAGLRCWFDPWDRLTEVDDAFGRRLAEFDYDGLGRRTIKRTFDPNNPGKPQETRHFYYSTDWRILQERVERPNKSLGLTPPDREYIWGLRGPDDLLFRERFLPNGQIERLYAARDANFHVVAILDAAGQVQERYRFDAFGLPQVLHPDFQPRAVNQSLFDWNILFGGYFHDAETGLYLVRRRVYHPGLGRWLQTDPAGDADSPNLYAYVAGNPATYVDPTGEIIPLVIGLFFLGGAIAGAIHGWSETILSSDGDASTGEQILGAGLGAVFGGLNPIGAYAGAGGAAAGYWGGRLTGAWDPVAGLQWGGLAGGLAGGFSSAARQGLRTAAGTSSRRAAIWSGSRTGVQAIVPELTGAAIGATAFGFAGGDPLHGATLGMFGGRLTAGARSFVLRPRNLRVNIFGEGEAPSFLDVSTNVRWARGRRLSTEVPRRSARDILIRNAPIVDPLSSNTLSEIARIARPGTRITLSQAAPSQADILLHAFAGRSRTIRDAMHPRPNLLYPEFSYDQHILQFRVGLSRWYSWWEYL
jgi:RHS repeat-associated protein